MFISETVDQGSDAFRQASDVSKGTGSSAADTLKEKTGAVGEGTKAASQQFEDSAAKVAEKLKQSVGWSSKDDKEL